MHNNSPHPSTCAPRSRSTGVQEARSSTFAPVPWSASSPKPEETIVVAVPEAAVYSAPRVSSASVNQDQVTSARKGSVPMSVSSGA